ncbi:MAG: TonB family protein [Terriglobales bacterium]
MAAGTAHNQEIRTGVPVPVPRLLVELEPWHRVFLDNLRDATLRRQPVPLLLTSRPAPFWPDVFVSSKLPRRSLAQSALYHLFALTVILAFPDFWSWRPWVPVQPTFAERKLTYYEVSEYLPSLSTGSAPAKVAHKGQPRYSKQPIISIPPRPDNSTQTIVDPVSPPILREEVRIPNVVVWTPVPAPAPVAAARRSASQLALPWLTPAVVPPPPASERRKLAALRLPKAPEPAVVEPPPSPEVPKRQLGELNIAELEPQIATPALPTPAQRVAAGDAEGTESPPPAGAQGISVGNQAVGQLIALGLNPAAPSGPVALPGGNRRGIFAATPEGTSGAPGTPDVAGGGSGPGGTGTAGASGPGSGSGDGNPSGVFIGGGPAVQGPVAVVAGESQNRPAAGPAGNNVTRERLLAAALPPRAPDIGRQPLPGASSTPPPGREDAKVEDQVFGPKRYYTMMLNMPNLTSAGGSWIVRFAELKESEDRSELTAPVATSKVDPAYPAELIRKRVEGKVTLYAVIRSDGTVGDVRVLRGFDEQLDDNARRALLRWRFRPASKNGVPVDLEAVVEIPFAIRKTPF